MSDNFVLVWGLLLAIYFFTKAVFTRKRERDEQRINKLYPKDNNCKHGSCYHNK